MAERATYARDVAILPTVQVAPVIKSGGFDEPFCFIRQDYSMPGFQGVNQAIRLTIIPANAILAWLNSNVRPP
jgi:hypothetical protein